GDQHAFPARRSSDLQLWQDPSGEGEGSAGSSGRTGRSRSENGAPWLRPGTSRGRAQEGRQLWEVPVTGGQKRGRLVSARDLLRRDRKSTRLNSSHAK